ncbi:MAG TPA: ATP-binding protein [Roseiflexaceae bacterium]|nr:ATP-binding protein [Roseiflexaceae bacterium]
MTSFAPLLALSLYDLLRQTGGDTSASALCSKAMLLHLSHTLEDLVLAQQPALLLVGFPEVDHWRVEQERYVELAATGRRLVFFAGHEPAELAPGTTHITLPEADPLRRESFLVVLSPRFSAVLCARDLLLPAEGESERCFETLWSFEPALVQMALAALRQVVAVYQPEALPDLDAAAAVLPACPPDPVVVNLFTGTIVRFSEQLGQRARRRERALAQQLRWRDDMTATLVHDMRVPLQSMLMALDLIHLEWGPEDTAQLELLSHARRDAQELRALIRLVADTQQLDAGQFQLRWQPLPPAQLIQEALAPLQHRIRQQELVLDVRVDAGVRLIWGDGALIGRVLQNLVGNAVKFTPVGGQIRVAVLADSDATVAIEVSDTGTGIEQAALPHIFERYYQADPDRRRGSGLGLYFCRLVAEAHGGRVQASSAPGHGACITIILASNPPAALFAPSTEEGV